MDEDDDGAERQDMVETIGETGSAVAGTLVGLALGGPLGAVVGAATSPLLAKAARVGSRAWNRRRARAIATVDDAFRIAGTSPEVALDGLLDDAEKADDFLRLLSQAAESDQSLTTAFSSLMAQVLAAPQSDPVSERVAIIGESLRGLRATHVRILQALAARGGVLRASELATVLEIPQIELRGVVRDLEARGMIKDREVHPIEWQLRELGKGIVEFTSKEGLNGGKLLPE